MNPVVRAVGKVLRLVGISSPEDSAERRRAESAALPSWRAKATAETSAQVRPEAKSAATGEQDPSGE